jgi:hypothetical protein
MERQAEARIEQPGGNHRNPRSRIPMMHVDMFDLLRLQSNRVASSQQGMEQSFYPPYRAFRPVKKHPRYQIRNPVPVPEAQPYGPRQGAPSLSGHKASELQVLHDYLGIQPSVHRRALSGN